MDEHPDPSSYSNLTGDMDQTVLTYDPLLMGSVQPVPPPPSIKPLPPTAPPPPNATIYNPIKDINKFTDSYMPAHNQPIHGNDNDIETDSNDDDDNTNGAINFNDAMIDYAESMWSHNNYKLHNYNKFDPITGQFSIDNDSNLQPPTKKRKLMTNPDNSDQYQYKNTPQNDRYSLTSLGFQPLAARAIIEKLDCLPKLRYCDEFHRDISAVIQLETNSITNRLNKQGVQDIYPTSNGLNKQYLYTECGINPNDAMSITKLRAHLLSKSISTVIFTKQKQDLQLKIKQNEKKYTHDIISAAQQKSLQIAKKLGFIPEFLKNSNDNNDTNDSEYTAEDGEIKEKNKKSPIKTPTKTISNALEIKKVKDLLTATTNTGNGEVPQPLEKQSAFTQFECKSVLKSDGSEYDKYDSDIKLPDPHIKKYDSNFRPMFPITNKEYRFSIVSNYGYRMLNKYGYKSGEGLGKHSQGVTTFPRLSGQNSFKGINYAARNRKNINLGFIHCVACDKAFCGYQNLQTHIVSKKHLKNLQLKPNNLVLLCVQCQIQFPTLQKIKEHFMLVLHDDKVAGIQAFQKQLRNELRKNQIKYIQNLQTKPNPYDMEDVQEEKEEEEEEGNEATISLPLPQAIVAQKKVMPVAPVTAATSVNYNNYYSNLYANYYNYNYNNYAAAAAAYNNQYYSQQHAQQQYASYMQQQRPVEMAINAQISNDIKHKIYTLGLKLPMAVPTVPWIYCPSCGSFYTTFHKFNTHYNTQRHINCMSQLNEEDKEKMNQLFIYINQKQQQYSNQHFAQM